MTLKITAKAASIKFLGISGSARTTSTNTAMLKAVSEIAYPRHEMVVFSEVAELPVFSPDAESIALPEKVLEFVNIIRESDGLIISSLEYVHAIPGGLKNAIDWLVSGEEIIGKPIALMHASHRGDDMLGQLRLVLSTISEKFTQEPFFRLDLLKLSPEGVEEKLREPSNQSKIKQFLEDFERHCEKS